MAGERNMNAGRRTRLRSPLQIHVEGPSTRNHRLALLDMVLLGQQLQTAVYRVARVLLGESANLHPGRKPGEISKTCALEIIAIGPGSVSITCDLPVDRQTGMFGDLGEDALASLVMGIDLVAGDRAELPRGYDKGTLLALRECGRIFGHGVERIGFELRTSEGHWTTSYTPEVQARLIARIQGTVANRRVVEGRLLMADFKESGFRCRLHPAVGRPISCEFEDPQKDAVLAAITRHVRIVGDAVEIDGGIIGLKIEDIAIIESEARFGDSDFTVRPLSSLDDVDIDALALEQGVSPLTDADDVLGDFWPEDEDIDDFIHRVRMWRDEINAANAT